MYRLHPIRCGTLTSTKEATTYLTDRGQEITFPVFAFLLRPAGGTSGPTVLVDTGVKADGSAFIEGMGRTVGPPGGGPGPLLDGLERAGLSPDDVDYVVLTHLHHDHVANVDLFGASEVLVQERELAEARDPLPVFAGAIPEDDIEDVLAADLNAIDGGYRLHRDVELVPTPGHTAGQQSVVVDTEGGRYALVGDLVYTQHNLQPGLTALTDAAGREIETTPVDGDYLPPGILVDVEACYDSIRRIRERVGAGGTILGNHDLELEERAYPA